MEKLKGYKTVLFQIFNMLIGAVVGSGLLTPELGADVTANVQSAVSQFEVMMGSIIALIAAGGIAFRAVTSSKIFNKP